MSNQHSFWSVKPKFLLLNRMVMAGKIASGGGQMKSTQNDEEPQKIAIQAIFLHANRKRFPIYFTNHLGDRKKRDILNPARAPQIF